jgi:anti-sigma B factor antagonist
MKVEVRSQNDITIIDCTGDVDLYSSPPLREALLEKISLGSTSVLLNMTGVSYMDSSGIATLVEALQLSRKTKTRFGLYGLRSNARSVLELARLHKVFNIFEDEPEALDRIASTTPFGGV